MCSGCSNEIPLSLLATIAGPAYSFSVIWIGYLLLGRTRSLAQKSLGFAQIVSSMPFSRRLTPIFGSGDEVFFLRRLGVSHRIAWIVSLAVVLALTIPPVLRVYRVIDNRPKPLWLAGLVLVPFLAIGAVVFGVLQTLLLQNGVLDHTGFSVRQSWSRCGSWLPWGRSWCSAGMCSRC